MFLTIRESPPPVAMVDFNMTEPDGTIVALRRYVIGARTIYKGQSITARDADGNEAEAVVEEVGHALLRLFVSPAYQSRVEFDQGMILTVATGNYEVESSGGDTLALGVATNIEIGATA